MPRKTPAIERVLNEREKLVDSFVRCFESAEGQAVLAWLKGTYQDKSSVFGYRDTRVLDPYRTLVHEGCRLVYLEIKGMIEEGLNARAGTTANTADEPSIWDL